MIWRFKIRANRTSVETVIKEPVGWDANKIKISRDLKWHGVFFSRQGESAAGSLFQFEDEGAKVLQAEYDQYGSQGDMDLVIDLDCGKGFEPFETGRFNFSDYSKTTEGDCIVSIPVEQMNDMMTIRNRVDQKVNLQSLVAFDETTALTPYDRLSFPIILPSKGIFLQDEFKADADFETPVAGVPENNNPGTDSNSLNEEWGMIEVGFENNVSSEIGSTYVNPQARYNCVQTYAGILGCDSFNKFTMAGLPDISKIAPLDISSIVNFGRDTLNYDAIDNPCHLEFQVAGEFENLSCEELNSIRLIVMVLPEGKTGTVESDYDYVYVEPIGGALMGQTTPFSIYYNNLNYTLSQGDRIYFFIACWHVRKNLYHTQNAFRMKFNAGNFFRLTNISHTPPTECNVFAVNETISRIVEAISNDTVRAYSEYFGRTDSQPYSHAADGCGSLEAVTDGLRIRRQENKIPGNTTQFAMSLSGIFDGLNPIHNIGCGLEPDPARTGYNRFRVEPWSHFYNTDIIMYCRNVKKIKRSVYAKEVFSGFKHGYQRWEAEEYNGLDEFLTKRESRTSLKEVNNVLTQYSGLVGSGYAWEVTRRKGNNNSKDWRYDKEPFIVCLSRSSVPFEMTAAFTSVSNSCTVIPVNAMFVVGHTYRITGTVSNNVTRTVTAITPLIGGAYIIFFSAAMVTELGVLATFEDVTPGLLSVELGNVINAANIIEPETVYNYRISPVRNLLRWMNRLLTSYRQFDADAKIIFTDGEGNYFAEGELANAYCKLEAGVLAENATLNKDSFDDPDNARPFLWAERVVFDYPMEHCDYKAIKANPCGLIYFNNDCEEGWGHIADISYSPKEGTATFNLIPRVINS